MAIESMRKAYARDDVRELMLAREKFERDRASEIYHAKQEGREEGRNEAVRALARKMLASGMEVGKVAELTGLTLEELS